jgi:putative hydrolase of the HAD superfamily
MIKRLIFDIDNTLIDWKPEYDDSMKKALGKLQFPYDDVFFKKLVDAIEHYECVYPNYNKDNMLTLMYNYSGEYLPEAFFNLWQEELGFCADKADDDLIETLDYLHSKYELVILSNWFANAQTKRLETSGILKYFDYLYFPEAFTIKPTPMSFLTSIGNHMASECIMIGDNINSDIEAAISTGINAIYYNRDGVKQSKYKSIKHLIELKDIL